MQRDTAIVFHQQGTTPGGQIPGLTIELTRHEIFRAVLESLSKSFSKLFQD